MGRIAVEIFPWAIVKIIDIRIAQASTSHGRLYQSVRQHMKRDHRTTLIDKQKQFGTVDAPWHEHHIEQHALSPNRLHRRFPIQFYRWAFTYWTTQVPPALFHLSSRDGQVLIRLQEGTVCTLIVTSCRRYGLSHAHIIFHLP